MMLFCKSITRAASLDPEYYLEDCRLQPQHTQSLGI